MSEPRGLDCKSVVLEGWVVVRGTGELGGTVEYLYWSNRRISRFLEDNNLAVPPVTRTVTTPSLSWLPTFSRSTTSSGSLRPQVAKVIERSLGQIAVSRFNSPGPIKYAKGTSTVVFGQFKTWLVKPTRQPAVMFTAVDYDRRNQGSVAVCLFGSMENFPEYVQSSGPGIDGGLLTEGWVASSAPAVYNFIASHGTQLDDPYFDPEDMAVEALKIANSQGMSHAAEDTELGLNEPWRRAFTYGDAREAQWLAQIYLDVDLLTTDEGCRYGFRRVLVGAPLWIRTPDPRAIRLYATSDDVEITAPRKKQVEQKTTQPIAAPQPNLNDLEEASHVTARYPQSDDYQPQSVPIDSPLRPTVTIPFHIYRLLNAGFTAHMAAWAAEQVEVDAKYRILHLGDPFGTVFAWVWSYDKDEAMIMLADYMAALRGFEPLVGSIDPPIRLDEVLRALRPALPSRFSDYDEVVAMARLKVRKYYGADPNA